MISLWASGLLYPAEVMKLSWFCCVWHLAGLRCTPCRGGLSLCSPGVRQGPSCHYRDSATPKTRGQRMVNPFTVVQPLPFDCMLHVGWVVDISNSELNLYGLLSFVFDQSCALSMFSLFISYDHMSHMNHMQRLNCKTSFYPCFWHNYLVGWRHKQLVQILRWWL